MCFGGWHTSGPQKRTFNLVEKANGTFSLRSHRDRISDMQAEDSFILNGSVARDPTANDIYVVGNDSVHAYNLRSMRFRTVRPIVPDSSAAAGGSK